MRNPTGLCKCGCGQMTSRVLPKDAQRQGYEPGEHREYIHGHHRRGAKHTPEARAKMSDSISAYFRENEAWWKGRHHTEASKEKIRESRRGPKHWAWVGEKKLTTEGYVLIYVGHDHPMAIKHGRALEHRVVMSEHLGRRLLPTEDVHHINGDKQDNRVENLRVIDHGIHSSTQRTRLLSAAIRQLLRSGMSPKEVCEYLHVSPQTVRRYQEAR